ncbi:MAG: site-specific integrase [Gemmatimonadetes bacterium]|nr:site-specific integrase [Gemmatimonadota bacterium]
MSELRRKMLADLRIRNYAVRTQEIYIACVAQMARELGRSPDELSGEEVREYLRYLKEERGVSRSVFAQVVGALRFLYRETLGRPEMVPHIPYPRSKRRHPVVLSQEEVLRLLRAIRNLKHRTVALVLYGAGLRITEALALELRDIDSDRMVITVRHGKGDQDRQVALAAVLLDALRTYWRAYRPRRWLFPGKTTDQPLGPSTIQRALKAARVRAGIAKPAGPHVLRHNAESRIMPSRPLRLRKMLDPGAYGLGIIIGCPRTRGVDRWVGIARDWCREAWCGPAPAPSGACRRGGRSGLFRGTRGRARGRSRSDRRRDGAAPWRRCDGARAA